MSPRPSTYADALRGRPGEPALAENAPSGAASRAARGPRLLLRPLLRFVPVALGCGIVWHLYVLGLQPAWSEHRRLSAAHEVIAADNAALRSLHRDLELAQAAQEDPHYQERRRRWRAERLAARTRLPEAEDSRPADLGELALRLAAAAGTALPAEPHEPLEPHSADGAPAVASDGAASVAVPLPDPLVPAPDNAPSGGGPAATLPSPTASRAPSGVR
ncbi:MAG: hypothetical protein GC161_15560 [Planctomycetaceae bacterium]|nr:hypothetical protein [Planctomycetaceae bacterium]